MAKRLILFLKEPKAGQVKTRLTSLFSAEEAVELYQHFVKDILVQIQNLSLSQSITPYFFFAPEDAGNQISKEFSLSQDQCFPQVSGDLGIKMSAAFAQLFEEAKDPVLIIGTDSPGLPPQWIKFAFELLETKNIVLGPTFDGGYYLLGMDAFYPFLFHKISWSSEKVFQQTMTKIQKHHKSVTLLPPFYDVDVPKDLNQLLLYLKSCEDEGISTASHTYELLKQASFQEKLKKIQAE